jgi:hypothetical protein
MRHPLAVALPLLLFFLLSACGSSPRDRAALRGLRYLQTVADDPEHFQEHGTDLMWAFYTLSEAAADKELKLESKRIGERLAARWRVSHPKLPENAGVNAIYAYASGSLTADLLGIADAGMKLDIERAARRFGPRDFLSFDPYLEAVPHDLPESCSRCKSRNGRGLTVCRKCGAKLQMQDPFDILFDALITTYTGMRYGVRLGADLEDITRWIPQLRPYPKQAKASATYAITHIVYVLNDYDRYRLKPEWLPGEFDYLKAHALEALEGNDPETLGEYIDSLQVFGLPVSDPLVKRSMDYLLAHQNADGSWGDINEKDIYTRYHTTWTGIGGVMRYDWQREAVTSEVALRRMRR